jgi:hypothetical protein
MFPNTISGKKKLNLNYIDIDNQIIFPDQTTAYDKSGNVRYNTATNMLQLYVSPTWHNIDISSGVNMWSASGSDIINNTGANVISTGKFVTDTIQGKTAATNLSLISKKDDIAFVTTDAAKTLEFFYDAATYNSWCLRATNGVTNELITFLSNIYMDTKTLDAPYTKLVNVYPSSGSVININSATLKVDTINSLSTDTDLELEGNGTGKVKIADSLKVNALETYGTNQDMNFTTTGSGIFNFDCEPVSSAVGFNIYSSNIASGGEFYASVGKSSTQGIFFGYNYNSTPADCFAITGVRGLYDAFRYYADGRIHVNPVGTGVNKEFRSYVPMKVDTINKNANTNQIIMDRLVSGGTVEKNWGSVFGLDSYDKIILGTLSGYATIAGHNSALSAYANLYLNRPPGDPSAITALTYIHNPVISNNTSPTGVAGQLKYESSKLYYFNNSSWVDLSSDSLWETSSSSIQPEGTVTDIKINSISNKSGTELTINTDLISHVSAVSTTNAIVTHYAGSLTTENAVGLNIGKSSSNLTSLGYNYSSTAAANYGYLFYNDGTTNGQRIRWFNDRVEIPVKLLCDTIDPLTTSSNSNTVTIKNTSFGSAVVHTGTKNTISMKLTSALTGDTDYVKNYIGIDDNDNFYTNYTLSGTVSDYAEQGMTISGTERSFLKFYTAGAMSCSVPIKLVNYVGEYSGLQGSMAYNYTTDKPCVKTNSVGFTDLALITDIVPASKFDELKKENLSLKEDMKKLMIANNHLLNKLNAIYESLDMTYDKISKKAKKIEIDENQLSGSMLDLSGSIYK